MTIIPLDQLRLNARSHISALQWIGLLYRRPRAVQRAEEMLSRGQRVICALRIYCHVLPYLVILCTLGRWILFGVLKLVVNPQLLYGWTEGVLFHGFLLAVGLAISLIVGLVFSFFADLTKGLALGLAFGLAQGSFSGLGIIVDPVKGFVAGLAFGFPAGLASGVSLSSVLALTFLLGILGSGLVRGGLTFGLAIAPGFAFSYFRLYYVTFHWLWLSPRGRAKNYRYHPVAWDDVCLLPFPNLDRLLVAYAKDDAAAGELELNRLIDEYPSQRQAALRARAILVALSAAATDDLAKLDDMLTGLPEGKKGFLRETADLRRRVHEITALQARLDTLDRPFLREPFAALLVKEIEAFEAQIAGFKPPLSSEFRKAARQWLVIAQCQLDAARAAVAREPTRQVFRAGDPVNRESEAFVLRGPLLGELEHQVMLATGCPGLLIYGRRRMGKSTLLRNLEGFLPPRVQIVSLSMQQAGAFTSLPDLVGLIAKRVAAVVPETSEAPADLKSFEHFLESMQKHLEADDRRLLLAIDEYENLDEKIGEGVLSEDLLAVLRESIQTHRRIIWTFAGSHGIDELVHAPWTSYLVSARTIEVTPFEHAETRLLLTEPLKHSPLWRAIEGQRPRFEPGFWGEGGIERIHREAGGWPHLVQLVAETVVDLVNDSGGASVDGALLERALSKAVVRGNNVFLELLERESRLPGEWDYLRAFRSIEEQPVPIDEALDRSLRRRRLVVEEGGRYRLRVPLMARWLRERI